jgi:hypothetical protein
MADEDDIESYWEGLRPRREPDPPMTEEKRRAIMAGRRLGKSADFSALDMVRAIFRPVDQMVRFEGQIYQGLSDDEMDGLIARGGTLVPVRGLTQEEVNSSELVMAPEEQDSHPYSDAERLFQAYVRYSRDDHPNLTFAEQEQIDRHSVHRLPEEMSQEDLIANANRIRQEVASRRARGLAEIPLSVDGYSIQPHETLEEFANRAHLPYEVEMDPDELRTRAWEDSHVLADRGNPPDRHTIGNLTWQQTNYVEQLFQSWRTMTEEQQNWFQDQVTLARGDQPINRTALGIGTEIHRRIEAAAREATQGFVGQPANRDPVQEVLERMVNQIDLEGLLHQIFPENEPIDFGDLMRGPVRNPDRF